jgi:hypothetical protein
VSHFHRSSTHFFQLHLRAILLFTTDLCLEDFNLVHYLQWKGRITISSEVIYFTNQMHNRAQRRCSLSLASHSNSSCWTVSVSMLERLVAQCSVCVRNWTLPDCCSLDWSGDCASNHTLILRGLKPINSLGVLTSGGAQIEHRQTQVSFDSNWLPKQSTVSSVQGIPFVIALCQCFNTINTKVHHRILHTAIQIQFACLLCYSTEQSSTSEANSR